MLHPADSYVPANIGHRLDEHVGDQDDSDGSDNLSCDYETLQFVLRRPLCDRFRRRTVKSFLQGFYFGIFSARLGQGFLAFAKSLFSGLDLPMHFLKGISR
jgi:hypothetical protein